MYEKDVGYYGGSVALADYCPYIQEFTWRSNNVVVRGSHCMYEENNPSKYNMIKARMTFCKFGKKARTFFGKPHG